MIKIISVTQDEAEKEKYIVIARADDGRKFWTDAFLPCGLASDEFDRLIYSIAESSLRGLQDCEK